MHPRVCELVESLELLPHPEGGYYREVFRSDALVSPADGRGSRPAVTSTYFLLAGDQHSRWHVVESDETWHYYEGDPLELLIVDPDALTLERHILGPAGDDRNPVQVVPAGHWQAARPLGNYTLVGCTVGPGFVFEDFQLLTDNQEAASIVRDKLGAFAKLL